MSTQDPEEIEALRNEIQAAIAAGRELGPDMDKHLADSALERYQRERAARERALGRPAQTAPARPGFPGTPALGGSSGEMIARAVVTVAGIAAFLAIVILKPELWWVIFFMPAIAGWWGWGRWGHHGPPNPDFPTRYDMRMARRQARMRRYQADGPDHPEYD